MTATAPVIADLLVLGSTVTGITAGSTLSDGARYDIPAGAKLTVMLPNGRTRELTGPQRGAVSDLTQQAGANASLWDMVKRVVGGAAGSDQNVGATRGLTAAAVATPGGHSWTALPLDVAGNWCVERGAPLSFERAEARHEVRLTLMETGSSARAEVMLDAKQTRAPWPATMAPKAASYTLLQPDQPMRQVTLRPIGPLPSRDDTLALLHAERCTRQFDTWLKGLRQK